MFLAAGNALDHVLPHELFRVGGVGVSNQMLMAGVSGLILVVGLPLLFCKASSDAPRGTRNFVEAILDYLRSDVFRPALGDHTDRFAPFLWTLFLFIVLCNLLGSVPWGDILFLLTLGHDPALRHVCGTATGRMSTTVALAGIAFVTVHLSGVLQSARNLRQGGGHGHHEGHGHSAHEANEVHGMNPVLAGVAALPVYLWNFAPHPFKPGPGGSRVAWVADVPVWAMLLVLEMIGAVVKPVSLSIRLFANMIAGHIVLAVLLGLIPVSAGILVQLGQGVPISVLSLLIRVLELFVAVLQAFIFTFLVTLYIGSSVAPEH